MPHWRISLLLALLFPATAAFGSELISSSSTAVALRSRLGDGTWVDQIAPCTIGSTKETGLISSIQMNSTASACNWLAQSALTAYMAGNPDATKCYYATGTLSALTCGRSACGMDNTCPGSLCTLKILADARSPQTEVPSFIVQSLRYAIPGNATKVTYTLGDSHGTSFELANSQSNTLTIGWEAGKDATGFVSAGGSYKLTHSTSKKLSVQQTSQVTEVFSNFSDPPDHGKDVFSLWINPKVTKYPICYAGYSQAGAQWSSDYYAFGASNVPWQNPVCATGMPCFWDFTVNELLNPALVTDPYRSAFLSQISTDDVLNGILVLDPFYDIATQTFASYPPFANTNRFRPSQDLCGNAYSGIPYAVSKGASYDCRATYSSTVDTKEVWDHEWAVSAKFVVKSITLSDAASIKYTRTFTGSEGASNGSDIFIGTTSPGFCIAPAIAIDTFSNSYIVDAYTYQCNQP
jgi:hypothetical protein